MPVMNKHTDAEYIEPGAIPITRPHKWQNKYIIGVHGSREEVIDLFRRDLWRRIKAGEIALADLADLHGKQLVCVCFPKPCHGTVLEAAAAWAATQIEQR